MFPINLGRFRYRTAKRTPPSKKTKDSFCDRPCRSLQKSKPGTKKNPIRQCTFRNSNSQKDLASSCFLLSRAHTHLIVAQKSTRETWHWWSTVDSRQEIQSRRSHQTTAVVVCRGDIELFISHISVRIPNPPRPSLSRGCEACLRCGEVTSNSLPS